MENIIENIRESEYLIIPNPIYDVVFKYLMDDPESAIIVLSTLINEKIKKLHLKIKKLHLEPLTHTGKKEMPESYVAIPDPKTKDDIKLFHLDFTATIELPDGSEDLIMIELQKASEPDDIFRFKRYISKNFQKKHEKEITDPETHAIEIVKSPIKLIPVFILNFRIENEINDLLIRADRIKTGVFKNRSFQKHNEFIDNLSYDILVVQLPNLHNIQEEEYKNDEYKTKLYALLKLFDQKSRVKDNAHRLRLIRKFFPGFLDRVIARLRSAAIENPLLEEQMYAEDEYLKALIERDNKISYFEQKLDNEIKLSKEKDKTLDEKDKALEEKDKALEEKDKALEEK
ncbi:MAG: hypothetical protein HY738_12290 [Bacteroidia bacterium]|nr:hypothetical protein [Bacteroidia bacterium]